MGLNVLKEQVSPITNVKNIVAIAAGKGGVGKSTMTVSLASACRDLGLKVGILDADVYGPSMVQMLPKAKGPQEKDNFILPMHVAGLEVISLASFEKFGPSAIVRAPIANAVISQFISTVLWSDLDLLFVDFPPGTGDIQLTLMQSLDIKGAILVTMPNEVSLLDVKKSYVMFNELSVPVIGVVENMSYFEDPLTQSRQYIFGKDGGKHFAEQEKISFLGALPLDPEVARQLDRGDSIFSSPKGSPFKEKVTEIAIELSTQLCENSRVKETNFTYREVDHKYFELLREGEVKKISAFEVQSQCPCARCVDEESGRRVVTSEDPMLSFKHIRAVGAFGLAFQFSSGCNKGMYPWHYLWEL